MGDLSAADVLAMTRENGGNFLEGNGIIILLLFFLFMGGGYGGFNNAAANGALTRAEMQDGFNNQNTVNTLNSINMGISNGFNSVNSNLANLGFNMQNCCCDIKTTVHGEGEATRALISQQSGLILQQITNNTIQDLRDKVADKDRELNSAIFAASQLTQTRTLEDFILANK